MPHFNTFSGNNYHHFQGHGAYQALVRQFYSQNNQTPYNQSTYNQNPQTYMQFMQAFYNAIRNHYGSR